MEQFKIDYFEDEHGEGSFPPYRTLPPEDAQRVLTALKSKLGLPLDLEAPEVLEEMDRRSVEIENLNAEEDSFNLRSLLHALQFAAATVLVNWYRFDRIDEFQFEDLCAVFNDIFYPSADDLDIFDSNLTWLISVRHYGAVKVLRLNRNNRDRM